MISINLIFKAFLKNMKIARFLWFCRAFAALLAAKLMKSCVTLPDSFSACRLAVFKFAAEKLAGTRCRALTGRHLTYRPAKKYI